MQTFDTATTQSRLPFARLIPALQQAFAEGAQVPLRHNHSVECQGVQGTVLLMPAWSERGYFGLKTVNIYPANGQRGLPGLHATYILYDATTGVPLALMDGDAITARRTAAAAALGTHFLARADARRLLLLGCGRVGTLVPEAMRSVRPIETVQVWNPTAARADALVQQLQAQGFEATRVDGVDDLEAAARSADIISCATLSQTPLIRGAWLQPGTHLDLIGSFTPQMREADVDCLIGHQVCVDTEEAPMKAGELLDAFASGAFAREDIAATLADLCQGRHPGRTDAAAITVFKAVGTALEDLAAATLIYEAS